MAVADMRGLRECFVELDVGVAFRGPWERNEEGMLESVRILGCIGRARRSDGTFVLRLPWAVGDSEVKKHDGNDDENGIGWKIVRVQERVEVATKEWQDVLRVLWV